MKINRAAFRTMAAVAVIASIIAPVTVANAAPHTTSSTAVHMAEKSAQPSLAQLLDAVSKLSPFVVRQPAHTLVLEAPASVVASIPTDIYTAILSGNAEINSEIRSGVLDTTPDGEVFIVSERSRLRLLDGRNRLISHWYGFELDLNSYWTNKLLGALNAGAGAAAVAAVLASAGVISSPGAIPSGVASGVLWFGAGVIQTCSNSKGVKLFLVVITFPVIAPWCRGQ